MTRLLISSDLHLGHKNIHKYRTQFATAEEHHEFVFEQLATSVNKRDSLILLGDVAFSFEWLAKIADLKCAKKLLICGNHDTENGIKMRDLVKAYDDVMALHSRANYWFSHCPIHPQEMRNRKGNIHGHLHQKLVTIQANPVFPTPERKDPRYINVCVEHTNFKPISFADIINR